MALILILVSLFLVATPGAWSVRPSSSGASQDANVTRDESPPRLRQLIEAFLTAYADAVNRTDTDAIMSHLAPVSWVTTASNGQILRGPKAIRNQVERLNAIEAELTVSYGTIAIHTLSDKYVLVVAPYTLTASTPDGHVVVNAVSTLVLGDWDGSWKIVHEHNSAQPPDP